MARWWLSTEAGQRCSQRVLSVWNNGVAMKPIVSALLYAALATGLWAEVRLPTLFGDHMVIQRDLPVHVWGWADPGEAVKVEFLDQQASTTASEDGRWETYLEPARAGGPYSLEVRGANAIMIKDIHVGEVWVGSGQSNMVWPLRRSRDAEKEIASANYPGIRYFKVELDTSDTPQEDVRGEWRVVTPETAPELSGVAYFFARNLREKLELPLGLIQSAWGGTPAEAWTSLQTLSADHSLAGMVGEFEREAKAAKGAYDTSLANWEQRAAKAKSQGKDLPRKPPPPRALRPQQKPAALFNAMVAPLTPYPIRGTIWYQGENNGSRGQGLLYRRLFRSMIEDWRREWGLGAFPFLFVQLANYGRVPPQSTWPELREAQAWALGLVRTGMAVTIDIGNSSDIHPRNKQDVGLRLALAARAIAYGEKDLEYSGPVFRQATREAGAIRLWFDHASSGLQARDGALEGFEVAGVDGKFVEAEARIGGNIVVVSSPEVGVPVQARYAWGADPQGNLSNVAGLPASPFRTRRSLTAKVRVP